VEVESSDRSIWVPAPKGTHEDRDRAGSVVVTDHEYEGAVIQSLMSHKEDSSRQVQCSAVWCARDTV
jgi:hypothetical protein